MAAGWQSVRLDEIEPVSVVNDTLLWRPVRRTLDIGAFGINGYVAPSAGDDVVEEHDETALGHEEVYVVLNGHATFTLDGEPLAAPAGTIVFIRDPDVVRRARADEPGTQVLAIGGPREGVYETSPWEDYFAASRHRAAGDYEAYLEELEQVLERRPDHPATLYHVGKAKLLLGREDEALADIRRAGDLNPALRDHAASDDELASLRVRPDWSSSP